jgi:hypothetical protein
LSSDKNTSHRGRISIRDVLFVVLGLVGCFALLPLWPLIVWSMARDRRVSDFKAEVADRSFGLGQWVPIVFSFRLARPMHVKRIGFVFEGEEKTKPGESEPARDTVFHREQVVGLENVVVVVRPEASMNKGSDVAYRHQGQAQPVEPIFSWQTAIRMPSEGPSSEEGGRYRISGSIRFEGWSGFDFSEEIRVSNTLPPSENPVPERFHPAETSPNLLFLSPSDPLLRTMRISTRRGSLWHWLLLHYASIAGAGFAIREMLTQNQGPMTVMASIGGMVLTAILIVRALMK